VVLTALVGAAGVPPTVAAVRSGRRIALANKEALVVAGSIITPLARQHGADIVPVDSEHSAIFQCLTGEPGGTIEKLILTASGGPFRQRPAGSFGSVTREEALRHPTWNMGAKITIDSATMMNKGLEVVEAHWLFGVSPDDIQVVVHPQSVIHSIVQFHDGSAKAQLGAPDMRVPIQYALTYPDRWPATHPRLDWTELGALSFEAPDGDRFPCLALAFQALRTGGAAPAVLNAANEEAVRLFLEDRIRFVDIARLIESTLLELADEPGVTIDELLEADDRARRRVLELANVSVH
jgi:1-deoxy-D-xylulose-5-phosphate reductoisomerase